MASTLLPMHDLRCQCLGLAVANVMGGSVLRHSKAVPEAIGEVWYLASEGSRIVWIVQAVEFGFGHKGRVMGLSSILALAILSGYVCLLSA